MIDQRAFLAEGRSAVFDNFEEHQFLSVVGQLRSALARSQDGDVVIDDPRSLRDLPRAAEASGHHVVHVGDGAAPWTITLEV